MQRKSGAPNTARSTRAITYALAGSLLGTMAMDLVMVVESVIMGMPVDGFWALIGSVVGGGTLEGAAIHFMTGSVLGLLFGLAVRQVRLLNIDSLQKGIWLGVLAGLVTIPFGCVPFALITGVSIVEMVSFSFTPHLVWGAVMGVVAGYGLAPAARSAEVSAAR